MNPLVHAELSWLLAHRLENRRQRALVTLAGVLPDLDGLTLLAGEDAYGRWHHVLTHSGFSAVLICGGLALLARERRARVFGFSVLAFHLHLVCDLLGSGPGWPISYLQPFSPVELMWQGQWNLASWQNSLIGLAATLGALACALTVSRTPVELFSLRADTAVVNTLKKRFAR